MSTTEGIPVTTERGGPAAPGRRVFRAPHAGDADYVIERCCAVLDAGRLTALTRITNGIVDFAIDDFYLVPDRGAATVPLTEFQLNYDSVTRLVSTFTVNEEVELDDLRTGRLIRVVLQGSGGAVYCYSVVPGQYLVGLVSTATPAPQGGGPAGAPAVAAGDQEMARLVGELRHRIGLPHQNPGGFIPLEAPQPGGQTRAAHVVGEPQLPEYGPCVAAVSPLDLHFVAVVRGNAVRLVADYFAHPDVTRFFALASMQLRREFYAHLAGGFSRTAGQLGRHVQSTVGGPLVRLVLDVEQGAIYYYRLGAGDHLVGVTLDQERVAAADTRLARLATELAAADR